MVDSGATHNFVHRDVVVRTGLDVSTGPSSDVQYADNRVGKVTQTCWLPIEFTPKLKVLVECFVLDSLSNEIVLGMAWLNKFNPSIDW